MKNKRQMKVALVLNIIIALLTFISFYMLFNHIKFMTGPETVIESDGLAHFKAFTIDSNFLMGIVAAIMAIYEYRVIKGKDKDISKTMYVIKLMATTSVALTFFIVFTYLGRIAPDGLISMIKNCNLFFHLVVPVLSIITFAFFEKSNKLNFKCTVYGIFPMIAYAVFYLTNVLVHMENGTVSPVYDWYWFVQNGVWTIVIVMPVMFLITYLISLVLWKLNKEKNRVN